jgi:hypothetical protein
MPRRKSPAASSPSRPFLTLLVSIALLAGDYLLGKYEAKREDYVDIVKQDVEIAELREELKQKTAMVCHSESEHNAPKVVERRTHEVRIEVREKECPKK